MLEGDLFGEKAGLERLHLHSHDMATPSCEVGWKCSVAVSPGGLEKGLLEELTSVGFMLWHMNLFSPFLPDE